MDIAGEQLSVKTVVVQTSKEWQLLLNEYFFLAKKISL